MSAITEKYKELINALRPLKNAAVAFSGGVDSALLLKAAKDALGENVLALTAVSCAFTEDDISEAENFCRAEGIRHIMVKTHELEIKGFAQNPPERCYICKKAIFTDFREIADKEGFTEILEGSNLDDETDYRPGFKAISELGIKSPLRDARFTKDEIRNLSKKLGLRSWNKPSEACLYSRFVYGEEINIKKLEMIKSGEKFLKSLGFSQVRVRLHDNLARIEVLPDEIRRIMREEVRVMVYNEFKRIGFSYVSMDLAGYRTGSMNEAGHNQTKQDKADYDNAGYP